MMTQSVSHSIREILRKAASGAGLLPEEAEMLLKCPDPDAVSVIFEHSRVLTERHFGRNIRFFAPLYYSDYCVNDCVYCSFRSGNDAMPRKILSEEELLTEARRLWEDGHRSLLLVAGEHRRVAGPDKLAAYADCLKKEGLYFDLAFEVGPLETEEYRALRACGFSRVVLYQETYDRAIYAQVHPYGPKKSFDWRYETPARALAAGIPGFGLGVLLGLAPDWRREVLELYRHAANLCRQFGSFALTFSFPRLRPADGFVPGHPEALVGDQDFAKIMAVTRLAFPAAGIVVSTRETAAFRRYLLETGAGVTQMSAGVSTATGGYTQKRVVETGQFDICDERPLSEVAAEAAELGFILKGVREKLF